MKAFNDFINDIFPFLIIVAGIVIWVKLTLRKHDVIVEYVKKQKGELKSKQFYTRKETDVDGSNFETTYYVIEYYDTQQRLHQVQLTVDEIEREIIIEQVKIITSHV
jgi:hypothetical protein